MLHLLGGFKLTFKLSYLYTKECTYSISYRLCCSVSLALDYVTIRRVEYNIQQAMAKTRKTENKEAREVTATHTELQKIYKPVPRFKGGCPNC